MRSHAFNNHHRRRTKKYDHQHPIVVSLAATTTFLVMVYAMRWIFSYSPNSTDLQNANGRSQRLPIGSKRRIPVYSIAQVDNPVARKQLQDLKQSLQTDTVILEPIALALHEQRNFVHSNSKTCMGKEAFERFDELVARQQEHLATELWKYCALASNKETGGSTFIDRVVYVDSGSPFMVRLQELLVRPGNFAVLGDSYFPRSIHGSLLVLQKDQLAIAEKMLRTLIDTSLEVLEVDPLLLPRTLYSQIATEAADDASTLISGKNGEDWFLFEQKCRVNPLIRSTQESGGDRTNSMVGEGGWASNTNSYRSNYHCPDESGFCCTVLDRWNSQAVLMSQHPLLPFQKLPSNQIAKPYNAEAGHYQEEELPFISTIQEKVFHRPQDSRLTPNFFDVLLSNECLPSSVECSRCLRQKTGANCKTCADICPCYCRTLCHEKVDSKHVAKEMTVAPPLYARDPNRLIPRIIHQTYFEELTQEKYPNMSRLVESFKKSGWDYRFYSDEEAASFLSTHFPAEIREAYDALLPGAFKADLFRYCALLIHGGVYADVDILLESALDLSVGPDVGFMVPFDEPGTKVNHRMCLWNGFIAAAPGHPFLAKAIETVINQVRNRFTSVDVDATFCPNPELSILHAFDTLFSAGPCLLGASVNRVLGLRAQNQFEAGEIQPAENVPTIPGRTIILNQNKWDMGAHRFTLVEQNLLVAATDLEESNDRDNVKESGEHYSKAHATKGIYGLQKLYQDNRRADEDIRIRVDYSRQDSKFRATQTL